MKFIDQVVLVYRFIEGEQLEEVAAHLNRNQTEQKYTVKSVSAIEQRAIEKLRKRLEEP